MGAGGDRGEVALARERSGVDASLLAEGSALSAMAVVDGSGTRLVRGERGGLTACGRRLCVWMGRARRPKYIFAWLLIECIAAGRGRHFVHRQAADDVGEAALTSSTRKQKARFA